MSPSADRLPAATPTVADATADGVLAARVVTGDRDAFEQIYHRYLNRIYGLSLRLARDADEAEILTQDTFVKAWTALAGYSGQGELGGWLGRIAVNLWRDRWRARARTRRLLEDVAREAEPVPPPGRGSVGADPRAAAAVVPLLTALDLERCIARLPEGARTVFVLHDIEGYTHDDIGDLLGVVAGTVKSQLHRARSLLRRMLDHDKEASHGA